VPSLIRPARLHFSPADGRIWLDDQRMLLIHSSALGVLRRELIESLGIDRARGLLTRMGYHAGSRDAQMARRVRRLIGLRLTTGGNRQPGAKV